MLNPSNTVQTPCSESLQDAKIYKPAEKLFSMRFRPRQGRERLCRKVAAMIVVRIAMRVLPEKQKEVEQTLLSLKAPMEREAGCLSYALLCDTKDKNLLCLLEEWENREKLDHHFKSEMFGILLGTKSLLQQSHDVHIYTVQKSEGMNAVLAARGKRDAGA